MQSTNGSAGACSRPGEEVEAGLLTHPAPGDHDYETDETPPPPPPDPPPDFPGGDDDPPSPGGKKPPGGDKGR